MRWRRARMACLALDRVEPLQQQDAVEVVDLVLEHPAHQLVALDGDGLAVDVEAVEQDPVGAEDRPVEVGHRQAALDVLPLAVVVGEGGVDDDAPARPVVDVVDEHPLLDADLGRGQAHAGSLVHGLQHVVGQAAEVGVELGDLAARAGGGRGRRRCGWGRGPSRPRVPAGPRRTTPSGLRRRAAGVEHVDHAGQLQHPADVGLRGRGPGCCRRPRRRRCAARRGRRRRRRR